MLLLFLAIAFSARSAYSQVVTKDVIDFCSLDDPTSCGEGKCIFHHTGNRCKCPDGWMGRRCARPCQDVYRSCTRWLEEGRCSWTRPISPFFTDNCGLSCGLCRSNGLKLPLTLPPILDNIAWFVGRWECKTTAGERFPEPMSGPYREILEVQISDVPMFDRPPVNVSTIAVTNDGRDVHSEVGFMTSKPFLEDTGFVEFNKPKQGDDLVGIETVSNNGLMLIEEGIVRGYVIKLDLKFKRSFFGPNHGPKSAKRMFILVKPDVMEERVIITDSRGVTKKWLKRYKRTFNYLEEYVRVSRQ
ncbi:hypothetical protein Y032_0067g79 [Ancylostoma ceylanicum]|uniref:EGF-like domain-containing protein n=2 Tax=Ancylostoma TaxID=29169 RepID=A0A016U0W1_9BILA|nr:hypothetical protein Y032_0067g79 [Ancylostoma ceylanicum]